MRRIIMGLFAITMGTALLVGLKSQSLATPFGPVGEGPLDPGVGDPPGTPGGIEPTGTAGPGATTGATPAPGGTQPATGGQTSTTAAPAATTNPPAATSKDYAGALVAVRTAQSPNPKSGSCGDCANYSMSVTITVSGGRITKASVSYSPSPGESQRYADKATNTLSPMVVSAQTWRLGSVSGATYSANAFELSLRDAMTKAGLPT